MTTEQRYADDVVTHVIKYCLEDKAFAENAFDNVAAEKKRTLRLPDGEVTLTEAQAGEFVERFSAEVEPAFWESKRRKS
ncbi:MAG: hypothetical protein GWO11_08350 [Desulfuromonadales bacterium]|nr:hypothetical protein [Desulfuromonadales bacterium]NIR34314.1 hypothetical protein [Desulfuromonadales bacterium]NIS44289.1 hypothetical protein [Desulfuromonadales bacterium]